MLDLSIVKKEMEHTAEVLLEKFSAIRDAKPTAKIFFNLKIKQSNGVTPLSYIADVQQNQSTFIIRLFNLEGSVKVYNEIAKVIADELSFPTNISEGQLHVKIPPLTQEKRNEYAKKIGQYTEEIKISLRNIRQKFNKEIQADKKSKTISENEEKRLMDQVQKIHDQCMSTLEKLQVEKVKSMQMN